MNNRDYRYFECARQEALKSDFERFNIGCVIVYKNHIIGRGFNSNKTDPTQKRLNRERNFNKGNRPIKHSIHAELAAIKSIPYPIAESIDWSKVKVYIYRISKGNDLGQGMARSCPACMKALLEKGVRQICYTTSDGFAQERIF